jgi:outer membrane protein
MRGVKAFAGAAASALLIVCMGPTPVLADTIEAALVRAYQNNPQLNAQRAQVRITDENVPQALSGYRPKVAITASAGVQYTDTLSTQGGTPDVLVKTPIVGENAPRSIGGTVTQTLFNGQQTANRTRAAEGQVSGAREALRALESTVLLSAATIYMDYLRDSAIVEVQKSNVRVLEQTLKQTRDRFNVGEVTRTDVAQSEAQLAAGKTQLLTAEANLTTTRQRAASAGTGLAGRPLPAVDAAGRRRTRPDAKSERHRVDVRHRRQLPPGQGGGRCAVADGHASGCGAAVL